jgi:hypothetical protein
VRASKGSSEREIRRRLKMGWIVFGWRIGPELEGGRILGIGLA